MVPIVLTGQETHNWQFWEATGHYRQRNARFCPKNGEIRHFDASNFEYRCSGKKIMAFHVKLPLQSPHPESILPCSEIPERYGHTHTQTDGISCAARIFSGQILRSAALRATLQKNNCVNNYWFIDHRKSLNEEQNFSDLFDMGVFLYVLEHADHESEV